MYAAIAPLLSQKLSGFLKGYSCSPAFLKMTEDWRVSLDAKVICKVSVAVVAVDLSKAFDSDNHNLLLAKLKAYGFSTTATNLIREYLKGIAKGYRLRVLVLNLNVSKQVFPRDLCLVHYYLRSR